MKKAMIEEQLERILILASLYDKLAAEKPVLPEEIAADTTELKLLKIELLKTVLAARRMVTEEEAVLDV